MKKWKDSAPEFSEEIDIYENTDPVDADSVDNVPLKQLHSNTLSNRELVKKLTSRLQKLEDLVRRLFAFSYDDDSETIYTNDEGVSYEGDTITLPEELAEYDAETGTIYLAGGTGGGGGGGVYILPTATSTRLGGVKIGENVGVETDGTISVDMDGTAEAAAALVEENATEPSDADIDALFK